MVKLFGRGRKEDFPELGTTGYSGLGVPGPASDSFGAPAAPGLPPLPSALPVPQTPSISSEQISTIAKNIDLLSSKLDTLKASLDALNQRFANIESHLKQAVSPPQPVQTQQPEFSQPSSSPQQQTSTEDQGWHY